MTSRAPWLTLGRLAPLTLLVLALVDVSLRFVPLEAFAFRAWEPATTGRAATGQFVANARFHYRWSYGDLSSLGDVPQLRQLREEWFTTDAYGFRNPPTTGRTRALLVGDSFAAGAGNSDDETLAARLGTDVYNLGGPSVAKLADIRAAAQRLKCEPCTVIYEVFEKTGPPMIEAAWFSAFPPRSADDSLPFLNVAESVSISRSQILAARAQKAVRALTQVGPATPANGVLMRELENGTPMLFLEDEVKTVTSARKLAPDFFVWLRDELERERLNLVVVLVPSKYTVYGRHLKTTDLPPPSESAFAQLEGALAAQKIPVVNLTCPFIEAATHDLADGQTIYWLDDTHWNPKGIALAAQLVAEALNTRAQGVKTPDAMVELSFGRRPRMGASAAEGPFIAIM